MAYPENLHIFCRVIDNFGDAGVCWRLARQLVHEHGIEVTLWLDDIACLKRMCPEVDAHVVCQMTREVCIRRWPDADVVSRPEDVADAVIEAFGCELPPAYIAAMVARQRAPAWVNLEYLSAEPWVEGCHALPSPQQSLTKHFFFPGFTGATGGLLRESDLFARRDAFQRSPEQIAAFFARLGVKVPGNARKVSLFCYPYAPIQALFETMQSGEQPVCCLVPEAVATDAVSAFLQQPAKAGATATCGALTVHVLPFLEQDDFDHLLWACDLNLIRGEDSFVRAQWAARPFVWHIYAQDESAHVAKLDAFLGRYIEQMPVSDALAVTRFHLVWNGIRDAGSLPEQWRVLLESLPQWAKHSTNWAQQLSRQENLASNLLRFFRKIG